MTDDLDSKSDGELNELFSVEVAGFVLFTGVGEPPMSEAQRAEPWCQRTRDGIFYIGEPYKLSHHHAPQTWGYMWTRPKYCADANAVLPWLKKWHSGHGWNGETYVVTVTHLNPHLRESRQWFGMSPSFARASVIALLRAKRAEQKP